MTTTKAAHTPGRKGRRILVDLKAVQRIAAMAYNDYSYGPRTRKGGDLQALASVNAAIAKATGGQ
jgi:hypothetical protein